MGVYSAVAGLLNSVTSHYRAEGAMPERDFSGLMFRPFGPGESIPTPGGLPGQKSSEITRTVRIDGKWVNVPSLWRKQDGGHILFGPEQMNDDQLSGFAARWEAAAGVRFRRFESEKDAVGAARSRSASGGSSAPASRFEGD